MERFRAAFWWPILVLLGGCLHDNTPAGADREVYRVIAEKEAKIFGRSTGFQIDPPNKVRTKETRKSSDVIRARGDETARAMDLPTALKTAIAQNREYKNRKEQLYLTALSLTGERYAFEPQFFATSSAASDRNPTGADPTNVRSQIGLDKLLKTGGQIAVRLASDVLRYYSGDPGRATTSVISLNVLQPLLRGSGSAIVAERLTQAERNVIYEIRDFTRFQHTFAVDIVGDYWSILQQEDTLRNEQRNFQNVTLSRERAEALSQDRLPVVQVDQARQDELRAKNRVIQAEQRLKESLDDYKLRLALPVGAELVLSASPLEEITTAGLTPVLDDPRRAFEIAVTRRMDILNEIDRFEDAKRQIVVAADALKPGLNLFGNASLRNSDPADYSQFNINDFVGSFGAELDLPIDRLRERNNFRAAQINFESRLRALAQAIDELRRELRSDLRSLQNARERYEIQNNARTLADRRVEAATLLLQAGRTQIRDLLEAQNAQITAQNATTEALLNYHVTRLQFLDDMGVLNTGEPRFWIRSQPVSEYSP